MGPERDLIVLCSQTDLSPRARAEIQRTLLQPIDWGLLKIVAGRNGLLPLIANTLTECFQSALPSEERQFFDGYLARHTGLNLHRTSRMIDIVGAFEDVGIDVLPFKGPSLAYQVYGNLALRDYVDLDLLVKPRDFEKSFEVLVAKGYSPLETQVEERSGRLIVRGRKDISFVDPAEDLRIELHWKLSGSHFALPYEIEDLWERLESIEIGGRSIRALATNDLIIYLCLHGSRHKWEKFGWVTDVNELVRRMDRNGGDWGAVREFAAAARCERLLDLGLFLIKRFYGTGPGASERLEEKTRSVFAKIADEVEATDFAEDFESRELSEWYLYQLSLKESLIDRMRVHYHYAIRYARLILRPGDMDKETFQLPPILYPLYYLLRPIRLVLKYPRKSGRKLKDV